jgi:cytochrome c
MKGCLRMKKIATVIGITASLIVATAVRADDEEKAKKLATSKNCLTCHHVDMKLVGPAYKEVAKKYKGNKDAEAMLIKKVIAGGSGVWGTIPMPPNVVKEEEAKLLVEWILAMH